MTARDTRTGLLGPGPGRGVMPAIQLAMKHVNRDPRLLKEYKLEMNSQDAQVSEGDKHAGRGN